MSAPVTDLTGRRLEALVAQEQSCARLPSLVAGIIRDGQLVWSGAHGAHTGAEAPTPDTQYRIGSITKTMTAVLVMQLRDDGLLDLEDRVDRHLPGIGYGDRTVRSLLSHSSGMQSEPAGSWWERSPGVGFAALAEAIDDSSAPLIPGHTYHYTNLAFGLLGEVVGRLRDGTWFEQVEERILRPLSMSRTSYLPVSPAATGYSVHHFAGTLTEEPAQDTGAMAAAGQLWSTVEDLAKFGGFLVAGDDDVLVRSSLDEMTIPQSGSLAGGATGTYGLGLRLPAGGPGRVVGHSGSMPGFLAGLFVDRVRRSGAVCLANGTTGLRAEELPINLLDILEELEPTLVEPWVPTPSVPDQVAEILGLWHWGNTAYAFGYDGSEVTVSHVADGSLSHRFRPSGDNTFVGTHGYHLAETLRVVRNHEGSINHLTCATFVYTRTPYDPSAPIPGGQP